MKGRLGQMSLIAGLWAALWVPLAFASVPTDKDKVRQIDELMKRSAESGQFSGSVLVVQGGKLLYKGGFGLADREWKIANRPDTRFRIGSITKSFTAVLVLQLAEQGLIRLDGRISDYLPDYRPDIGRKVTIHHLLTQTSGIQEFFQLPGFLEEAGRRTHAVDPFVRAYCGRWLRYEPGTRFEYCNSGYFILGAIIEKVTGKTYGQALREKILDPLGMTGTGLEESSSIIENRAAGYEKTMEGYVPTPYVDMSIPFAAGSMYSTVEDLWRWDQALTDGRLLAEEFRELPFRPYVEAIGARYGYGWVIDRKALSGSADKVACIWHGGVVNGFNALMERYVDHGHLIILLNNTGVTYLYEMAAAIRDILYGRPWRRPGKSVAEVLYATWTRGGIGSALRQYEELRDRPEGYNLHVYELYRLGSDLLAKGRVVDALEIFKLNAKAHPEEALVYDCLGLAYGLAGDKYLAIQNYGKSLELDPGNIPAIWKMRELLEKEEP